MGFVHTGLHSQTIFVALCTNVLILFCVTWTSAGCRLLLSAGNLQPSRDHCAMAQMSRHGDGHGVHSRSMPCAERQQLQQRLALRPVLGKGDRTDFASFRSKWCTNCYRMSLCLWTDMSSSRG